MKCIYCGREVGEVKVCPKCKGALEIEKPKPTKKSNKENK